MASYKNSLDEFKSKETTSLTIEEMKSSTDLLENLNRNLEEATEELGGINEDEELLEWPLTSASELPALLENIRPYYQLWNVAFQFHKNYDLWYRGTSYYLKNLIHLNYYYYHYILL